MLAVYVYNVCLPMPVSRVQSRARLPVTPAPLCSCSQLPAGWEPSLSLTPVCAGPGVVHSPPDHTQSPLHHPAQPGQPARQPGQEAAEWEPQLTDPVLAVLLVVVSADRRSPSSSDLGAEECAHHSEHVWILELSTKFHSARRRLLLGPSPC